MVNHKEFGKSKSNCGSSSSLQSPVAEIMADASAFVATLLVATTAADFASITAFQLAVTTAAASLLASIPAAYKHRAPSASVLIAAFSALITITSAPALTSAFIMVIMAYTLVPTGVVTTIITIASAPVSDSAFGTFAYSTCPCLHLKTWGWP